MDNQMPVRIGATDFRKDWPNKALLGCDMRVRHDGVTRIAVQPAVLHDHGEMRWSDQD
jgi:hypothetical protein